MTRITAQIRALEGCRPEQFPLQALLEAGEPVVLKGLVNDWGLEQAGLRSTQAAMAYLRSFYTGNPLPSHFGEPEVAGRMYYNEDFTRLNTVNRRERLDEVLGKI